MNKLKSIVTALKPLPLLFCLAGFIAFYWWLDLYAAIFVAILLIFLLYKLDSRLIVFLALGLLFLSFLLITFNETLDYEVAVTEEDVELIALIDKSAIYAFYFLMMSVVLQIVEYCRDCRDESVSRNKSSAKLKSKTKAKSKTKRKVKTARRKSK